MDMTDKQLLDLCQKFGSNAKLWSRKFAALLPEVDRRGLWKKKFHSIHEFAAQIGGLSARVVDEVLRLDKKLEEKPLLKAEIAEEGWAKVSIASRIEVSEKEAVKMVKTLPSKTLQTFAKDVDRAEECPKRTIDCKMQPITFKLDSETHFQLKKFQQKLEKEKGEPLVLGEVLKELLKLVPQDQSVGGSSRIPAKQRRELRKEHNGRCPVRKCKNPATEFHHTKRFAKHKTHEGVVLICKHHHQMAHAGLIENEHDPPEEWRVRKKMQPNSIDRKYLKQLSLTGEP